MQKTSWPYTKDKIITKILLIKKLPNSVKIKEKKLKNIAEEKTFYSKG